MIPFYIRNVLFTTEENDDYVDDAIMGPSLI